MRLLNVEGIDLDIVKVESFRPPYPPYLVLSHTWSLDRDEEVSFHDVYDGELHYLKKRAWREKVRGFCKAAKNVGYSYVWIDTCCIDQANNTELTEAINRHVRHVPVCHSMSRPHRRHKTGHRGHDDIREREKIQVETSKVVYERMDIARACRPKETRLAKSQAKHIEYGGDDDDDEEENDVDDDDDEGLSILVSGSRVR
ncbi:hypothetical protein DL765_003037 [Monosporascus sp. GIB2]|nr:hypothetical protein DL765_003037 [Monosporascus sp. GIB2]